MIRTRHIRDFSETGRETDILITLGHAVGDMLQTFINCPGAIITVNSGSVLVTDTRLYDPLVSYYPPMGYSDDEYVRLRRLARVFGLVHWWRKDWQDGTHRVAPDEIVKQAQGRRVPLLTEPPPSHLEVALYGAAWFVGRDPITVPASADTKSIASALALAIEAELSTGTPYEPTFTDLIGG